MRSIVINTYGNEDVLEIIEEDIPVINASQVLVKVRAFSINPVEYKIRRGDLKFITGKKFPMRLGSDICGEVVEVGAHVIGFKPGDQIYGMLNYMKSGGYTEYIAVKPDIITYKPQNLTHEESAALPMAGLTALQALRNLAGLKPGDKVLINGASGGVGHCAVQIAVALGAEVTAVCSSKNTAFVKRLGAKNIIDYTKTDLYTSAEYYDVFFDVVANQNFSSVKKILTKKGMHISTLPNVMIFLHALYTSLFSGKRVKYIMVKPGNKDMMQLTRLVENNQLKPSIEKVYNFKEIERAHKNLEGNRVVGKLVIKVD